MSSPSPARIKISPEEAADYEPPKFRSTNTLKELIDQLSSASRSDKDKSNAALAIQYLSLNVEKAVSIVHMPHAVRGLAELLNSGTDEARQHAAGAIAHLAVNDEAELAISSTPGVLDSLGILLWNGNEEAKQEAAAALENVSYSTPTARMVSKIEQVIEGLAQLLCTGTTMGKERAVGALQNLAVLSECRVRIATAPGALKGLASLLWTGSPKAQQDAAATIGNLAVSPEVRESVGRTDGVMEGLVMLLEGETEKGKSDAAAAIGNLAVNADLRNDLLELPRILLGLRSMLVDGPEKHAGEAACCLQNLAVTTVEKKLMIAETPGLLLGLINLMIRCKPQSQYHEDSCSALLNLVVGCSENKKTVATVPGVFEALGRCMVSGSDRTKEHAVAILQNLAFHSHANRALIVKSPTTIDGINFLVHQGPDKAAEYAAATTGSLARSEPGCRAILNSRGLLEGLVAMAQRSTPSSGLLKAAVTALFSLARCHAVSAVLIREAVVENALLPVLEASDSTETGQRIAVQAAVGIAHLGRAQTSLLDLFPSVGLDVLLEAVGNALPAGRATGSKIHLIDLLQAVYYIASQDEFKVYFAQKGLPEMLVEILQSEAAAKEPPLLIEALKLSWQLGFEEASRTAFLDKGVAELLRDLDQGTPPDWQALVASDGLHWQLANGPGQALAPGVDWEGGEPGDALGDEEQELERRHGSRLILILDASDYATARPFMENLKVGGHWIWPRTAATPPVVSISDYAAGLYDAQVAVLFMSSACEINPSCRSQILHAKMKGIPLLPLRVNPTYTPHGHLAFIPGVINCPTSAADGGRSSSLLKMVRNVAPTTELPSEKRSLSVREPSYPSPISTSSSPGREPDPELMLREVERSPGSVPRSRRDPHSASSTSRSALGDSHLASMSPGMPPARSPEPAVQAPVHLGLRATAAATSTVPHSKANPAHDSAGSQARAAVADSEQQTSERSRPRDYKESTSTGISRGTDSRGTDVGTATRHRGTDAATATTHRGADVGTGTSHWGADAGTATTFRGDAGTETAFRVADAATATTHRGEDVGTATSYRGGDAGTEKAFRGADAATAATHQGVDAATATTHRGTNAATATEVTARNSATQATAILVDAVEEATQTSTAPGPQPSSHDRGQQASSSHERSPNSVPPRSNPSRRLSTEPRPLPNEAQRITNEPHAAPRTSNDSGRFSTDSQRFSSEPQRGYSKPWGTPIESPHPSNESRHLPNESRQLPNESRHLPNESRHPPNESRRFSSESRRFSNESQRLANDTAQVRRERGAVVDNFRPPANINSSGGSVWDKVEVEDLHRMIRSQDETIRRQQSEMEKMQLQLQIQGEGLRRHEEKSRNGSLTPPSPPNVRFSYHGLAMTPALGTDRTPTALPDARGRSPNDPPNKSLAERLRDEGYRRKDPWQITEPAASAARPAMPAAAKPLDLAAADRRGATGMPRPARSRSPGPGYTASPGGGGVVSVETVGTSRVGLVGGGSEREEELLQAITRLTDGMLRRLENRLDGRVRDQVRQCVELERAALWGPDLTPSESSIPKIEHWGGDVSNTMSTPVLHRPSASLINSLSYPRAGSTPSPPRVRDDSFARSDQGHRGRPPSSAWGSSPRHNVGGAERRHSPPSGNRSVSGRPPVSPQKIVIAECL